MIRDNRKDITNYFIGDVSCHDYYKAMYVLKKMCEA